LFRAERAGSAQRRGAEGAGPKSGSLLVALAQSNRGPRGRQRDFGRFHPISETQVVSLTEEVRDRAAAAIGRDARIPAQTERFLNGRSASPDDSNRRIRIVAVPSLGHPQASPAIRRVRILILRDCPIPAADVARAFSGLPIFGVGTNPLDRRRPGESSRRERTDEVLPQSELFFSIWAGQTVSEIQEVV
jgi:hypothetical protein